MRGHEVVILERVAVGHWAIHCSCFATIRADDPIEAHRRHQDHLAAEFQAEVSGVERASS